MADSIGQKLLFSFVGDLTPLKQAFADAANLQAQFNVKNQQLLDSGKQLVEGQKQQGQAAKQAAAESLAATRQQAAEQKVAQQAALAQIKQSTLETVNQERAKQAAIKTGIAESLGEDRKAHEQRMMQIQEETAAIRKQYAEQRLQAQEASKAAKESGTSAAAPGLLGKVVGAASGVGLAGSLAGGIVAGGGTLIALDMVKDGVVDLIAKLRELSVEAGKSVQIEAIFRGIAKGAGFDANETIKKMIDSTEGLVSKTNLLKAANTALESSAHLTADQVANLMGYITKLAQASGKDATEAIQKFTTAMGSGGEGLRRLGREFPILAGSLREIQPPKGMDEIQKQAYLATQTYELFRKKAEELGELPDTLEENMVRLKNVTDSLFGAFAKGFNVSPGAQVFYKFLQGLFGEIREGTSVAEKLGIALGNSLAAVGPIIEVVIASFKALFDVAKALIGAVVDVGASLFFLKASGSGALKAVASGFIFMAGAIREVDVLVVGLVNSLKALAVPWKSFYDALTGHGTFKKFAEDALEAPARAGKALVETYKQMNAIEVEASAKSEAFKATFDKAFSAGPREIKAIPSGGSAGHGGAVAATDTRSRLAQMRLKYQEELDKALLAEKQAQIERERQLDELAYGAAEESAKQHFAKMRDFAKQDADARREGVQSDLKAQIAEARDKNKTDPVQFTRAEMNLAIATAQQVANVKMTGIERDYQKQLTEIDKAEGSARIAAIRDETDKKLKLYTESAQRHLKQVEDAAASELKTETTRVKSAEQINKAKFNQGAETPDAYFSTEQQLFEQLMQAEVKASATRTAAIVQQANDERDARIAAANDVYNVMVANGQGQLALQKQQEAVTEARAKAEDTVTAAIQASRDAVEQSVTNEQEKLKQLAQSRSEEILNYVQRKYGPQQQQIETHLQTLDMGELGGGGLGGVQKQSFTQAMLDNLGKQKVELEAQLAVAQKYSDTWYKIQDAIEKTTQKQVQYTAKLADMRDITKPIADMFSSLAGVGSGLFTSNWAQNFFSSIGSGAKGLGQASARSAIIGATPEEGTYAHFSTAITDITKRVTSAAGAIGDFATTVTKANSGISGAVGGSIGGAGLGQSFSGLMGSFGPFGAAAGAIGGGVIGAITGSKNAEVTRNIDKLQNEYKSLMNQFGENTNNLQQTISQLTVLIAQAQAMQKDSKKGGGKYQQVIDQYNQQLVQLQQQQVQIIQNMREQLAVMSAPPGMGDFISQLQDMINQYDKFVGASKNATDLANANQYLTQSLGNAVNNLEQQFGQDEQTAIQDALQLNDLLTQRQDIVQNLRDLTLNLNSQIENILGQGVLTRQMTFAQSKGQQIGQLETDANKQIAAANKQLEQLDMQKQVTQHRLDAEQAIFKLSTDRIGLEMQLVKVQNALADTQMQNVSGLARLLNQIQSGGLTQNPSVNALLQASPGVSNQGVGFGGMGTLNSLLSQAYQSYAQLGLAGFNAATF